MSNQIPRIGFENTLNITHGALVHLSSDLVGGPRLAQEFAARLHKNIQIQAISSVYKRFLSVGQVDLNARMEFVLRVGSSFSPEDLLVEATLAARNIEVTLLGFDNLILMSPKLTLPYPQLHTDPLIIRCAAEAWGEYEHPVYQKTLSELSRTARPNIAAEFFLQGRSLIDI